MNSLLTKLRTHLTLADPGLVGCVRRNKWSGQGTTPWRWLRGNALLATLGEKRVCYVDVKPHIMEVYLFHDWLLLFRGGQWNMDWTEDFFDTWAIARATHPDISRTIMVLHENKGDLSIKQVSVPESFDHEARLEALYVAYDTEARIAKNTPRALRTCKYCPHKQRCDALDKLHNQTSDWHESYPYP